MCKGHALTRSIFCLRREGRLLHKKQTIVDLGLLVRNRLPQIFFREGKHVCADLSGSSGIHSSRQINVSNERERHDNKL